MQTNTDKIAVQGTTVGGHLTSKFFFLMEMIVLNGKKIFRRSRSKRIHIVKFRDFNSLWE